MELVGLSSGLCNRFPQGDSACTETTSEAEDELPTEARLVKYLQIWRDNHNASIHDGRPVKTALSEVLEWFICQCLGYSSDNDVRNWWSDGVIDLRISQRGARSFDLLGVTWIGSEGIAPFEIEAVLGNDDSHSLARCIFRIGSRDYRGRPFVYDCGLACQRVLDDRPQRNADWAVAIELTPNTGT